MAAVESAAPLCYTPAVRFVKDIKGLRLFRDIKAFAARRPRLTVAVALAALYLLVVAVKLYHWAPGLYFYSDPAFRFRYVDLVATGEGIPALDRAAQWPEGVEPGRAFFLTQDLFIGGSYRLLGPLLASPAPHNFLRWHVSLWSSLSLFVVYFWARRLTGSRRGALLAALIYAFALPIYLRTCGNYLREDFVLPVYFFALYGQMRVVEGGGWRWAGAAAAARRCRWRRWRLRRASPAAWPGPRPRSSSPPSWRTSTRRSAPRCFWPRPPSRSWPPSA
jgi:hypothetical protein